MADVPDGFKDPEDSGKKAAGEEALVAIQASELDAALERAVVAGAELGAEIVGSELRAGDALPPSLARVDWVCYCTIVAG